MPFREITCQQACTELKRKIPYGWDMNPYRGCGHGCVYCYAMGTHGYLGSEDFTHDICVKTNLAECLDRQLASPGWKREVVNLGGVTDSYQPAEAHYRLMPDILRLLIKYRTPCIISTKSDLVLRDFDLIDELSRLTYVNVAATVTCMDESLRRKIEPGGAPSLRRFAMLREFSKTEASTGLHVMPIIPFLTDSRENIDGLYAQAKESRVAYVLPGTLYLRGKTRGEFFAFIEREFPQLEQAFRELYRTGGAPKEYKESLYQMVNERKAHYGLSGSYSAPMKEKLAKARVREREESGQQSLFAPAEDGA